MGGTPIFARAAERIRPKKNKKKLKKVLTNELIFAIISSEGEGRKQGNPQDARCRSKTSLIKTHHRKPKSYFAVYKCEAT